MLSEMTYPFSLPKLPYAYDALEPYIDADTMYFHHDKHFQAYVDNLNAALEGYPVFQSWSLEQLLGGLEALPEGLRTAVRNNGGGVYNHWLYFDLMTPQIQGNPQVFPPVFGQKEKLEALLKQAAMGIFGSGFAWLAADGRGRLSILALANQDNPLSYGFYPILPLDVWEHAYYLKYQNLRGNYIDNWFQVANWTKAAGRQSASGLHLL